MKEDRRKRTGFLHHSFKTHCKNGHSFSGENLLVSGGQRKCRICTKKAKIAFQERAKLKRKTNIETDWWD